MATLFISDLHLSRERPRITEQLFSFLGSTSRGADALYVLGDLFDYWVGDDDLSDPFNESVAQHFAELGKERVPLYFQHGNRDFLLGEKFAEATGGELLPEYYALNLYGQPTLLLHGDQLCTDDVSYQAFRRQVRDPAWQQAMLRLPLAERKARARSFREASDLAKAEKSMEIMDVNADAVAAVFRQYSYPRMIHGHTHRPARHVHPVDGRNCERWVLADWCNEGSYLLCDERGCRAMTLTK